jgi:hypothetical protein
MLKQRSRRRSTEVQLPVVAWLLKRRGGLFAFRSSPLLSSPLEVRIVGHKAASHLTEQVSFGDGGAVGFLVERLVTAQVLGQLVVGLDREARDLGDVKRRQSDVRFHNCPPTISTRFSVE